MPCRRPSAVDYETLIANIEIIIQPNHQISSHCSNISFPLLRSSTRQNGQKIAMIANEFIYSFFYLFIFCVVIHIWTPPYSVLGNRLHGLKRRAGNKLLPEPMMDLLTSWRIYASSGLRASFIHKTHYRTDQSHKSHNAPLPYPTNYNAPFRNRNVHCVHISVTKWCIVGYLYDALCDLQIWSTMELEYCDSHQSDTSYVTANFFVKPYQELNMFS